VYANLLDVASSGQYPHTLEDDRASQYALRLSQKHAELEASAVTCPEGGCLCNDEDYTDQKGDFREGEIYRVSHPTNTEVHLQTFLVMAVHGVEMSCVKIVQLDVVNHKDKGRYKRLRIGVEQAAPRRSSRVFSQHKRAELPEEDDEDSYTVLMGNSQTMKENCWVQLLPAWTINKAQDYRFAYCGSLSHSSLARARNDHWNELKLFYKNYSNDS
jgi:hypothetical protein